MSNQRCRTCKWLQHVLKASENDYWYCGCPNVPKPYVELLVKANRFYVTGSLSVGDPDSDYGTTCPTWEGKL